MDRSENVVTLMLKGEPRTNRGVIPCRSIACASSVTAIPAFHDILERLASRANVNAWGVSARHNPDDPPCRPDARRARASPYRRWAPPAPRPRSNARGHFQRRRARRREVGRRKTGARRIVHQNPIPSAPAWPSSALRPFITDSCRLAPPRVVCNFRCARDAATAGQRRSSAASATTMPSTRVSAQQRGQRPFEDRGTAQRRVLLGSHGM